MDALVAAGRARFYLFDQAFERLSEMVDKFDALENKKKGNRKSSAFFFFFLVVCSLCN